VISEESERRVGGYGRRRGREVEHESVDLQDRRVPRFFVHDATGKIAVDTAGASLDLLETVARYEAYTGLRGSEREIWREERALPLGNRVYVLGYLGTDGDTPVIGRHPDDPGRRFLISYRDERALAGSLRLRAYGLYLAGGLSLGGAAALLAAAFVW
jgi:E3 Ubiquitin ligase